MKRYLYLAIFFLSFHGLLNASSDRTQEATDLIHAAVEKTNIFALPHFLMKGDIHIKDEKGKLLDGAYLLVWNGPDQWKEEISLPGYFEEQVGVKGVVYLKRPTDALPLRVGWLHNTLGYGSSASRDSYIQIAPQNGETVQKIVDRKIRGTKAKCVEITNVAKDNREVCVDASSGILLRYDSFLDKEIMPAGPKLFPHVLAYVVDGSPVIEVRITEFSTSEKFTPADFVAPVGASSRPGCMNPVPARLIKRVIAEYPEEDRRARSQGTVSVYVLIAKDGSVQSARVLLGVSPSLNTATVEGIKQWHYEPATCNGMAVDTETIVTTEYSLSEH